MTDDQIDELIEKVVAAYDGPNFYASAHAIVRHYIPNSSACTACGWPVSSECNKCRFITEKQELSERTKLLAMMAATLRASSEFTSDTAEDCIDDAEYILAEVENRQK